MTFKDLRLGDRFRFHSEVDPASRGWGLAKGPWVKISPRKYMHADPASILHGRDMACQVGSINVRVIPEA